MQLRKIVSVLLPGVLAVQSFAGAAPVVSGFERFGADAATGVSPGLLLYNELKCSACHGMLTPALSAFPARTAPELQNASERSRFHYLKRFIAAPHNTKPGTTMPDLLAGGDAVENAEASEALAHFLLSLGGDFQTDAEEPTPELLKRGAHLYHTVGCVGCHDPARPPERGGAPDDIFGGDTPVEMPAIKVPSVPLPDLAKKTSATALAAFLRDPAHARPGGRMPDMTLGEEEATAIANWLIYSNETPGKERGTVTQGVTVSGGLQPAHDPAKAEHGRALFQTLGCAACHEVEDTHSVPSAPDLDANANWSGGCLAEAPTQRAPWFDLSSAQREALAGLKDQFDTPAPSKEDIVNHTILALNCYACHDRDGLGGPETGRAAYFTETEELDLGEEGRMPPGLTGVGAKLTPEWLMDILTDGGRIRPYMATRMPHFPEEHVAPLAEALLEVDKDPDPPPVNVTGLEHHHRNHYGRKLMGVNGLGCVTCHDLDGHRSLGIPAVDLANVPDRLQPAWFLEYMLDPASLRPQTRMPAFFEDGKSLGSTRFMGDAQKQIEALWIYLREVSETRLPEGMEDDTDYELRPKDRPLVHRTFIEDVGPHAIAVGFPGGLNYAYDARTIRPALVWRGRFIDAESAWADRYVPFVKPLGDDVARLPAGATVAESVEGPWDSAGIRFLGYRLDADRVPVFRYRLGDVELEESFRPTDKGTSFARQLTFRGPSQTFYLRAGFDAADVYRTDDINLVITDTGNETDSERVPEGAEFMTSEYRQGDITVKMPPRRKQGPEEVGWVIPVEVTESGTTIEQVISW